MNWKLSLVISLAVAAQQPIGTGFSPERVARLKAALKETVDRKEFAGIHVGVMRKGKLAINESFGYQDMEAGKPMRADTIFQIMSMTKPFVGTSIMMLADEGKLSISDPVEKHLPEFRGQLLTAARNADGSTLVKKPARPITIFDLMTHTSGMSYLPPAGIAELNQRMNYKLADAVLLYSQMPLEFEPGSKWQYSNLGIAILGRIIEVRSAMAFEKFLETRIFTPLGMKDSHIFLPAEKHSRLAAIYRKTATGMEKAGGTMLGGDSMQFRKGAVYSAPEWGLYSTAADLAAFYQMLLNGGVVNGKRIISKAAINLMTSKQTGDLRSGHMPFTAFGLTWEVIDDPRGELAYLSTGTFGHGGAFGTHGWVDRKKDIVGVYLVQMTAIDATGKYAFMQMANAAILD